MFSDSVLEPSDRLHGKGHLSPKPNLYIDLRTLSVTRAYHIDCKVPSILFEIFTKRYTSGMYNIWKEDATPAKIRCEVLDDV